MPPLDHPYRILMVEDNPTDVRLIEEAFLEHNIPYELAVLRDGETALRHLEDIADNPKPNLVILDLNIPKQSGFGVLDRYRVSDSLRSVPIVVLTSSDSPSDRRRAESLGVSAFLPKPMTLEGFIALGPKFKAILETPYSYVPSSGSGL